MISPNLSAIFYLISGVLFILALRGLSSPETSRQGNFFGIIRNDNCNNCNLFINRKFFKWIYFCFDFSSNWWVSIGAFIAYKIPMTAMQN